MVVSWWLFTMIESQNHQKTYPNLHENPIKSTIHGSKCTSPMDMGISLPETKTVGGVGPPHLLHRLHVCLWTHIISPPRQKENMLFDKGWGRTLLLKKTRKTWYTVDGRNPAPRGMYKDLLNDGINYQPQLVQDLFHQRYHVPWGPKNPIKKSRFYGLKLCRL